MAQRNFTTLERTYDFIVKYKRAHDGAPPTLSEVAGARGVSIRLIRRHLKRLAADGWITLDSASGHARITVTGARWLPPDAPELEPVTLALSGMNELPFGEPGSAERDTWHAVRAARMHLADAESARDEVDRLREENRQLRDNNKERRLMLASQSDEIGRLERDSARLARRVEADGTRTAKLLRHIARITGRDVEAGDDNAEALEQLERGITELERQIKELNERITDAERDLEWFQVEADRETRYWKGKTAYYYHLAKPRQLLPVYVPGSIEAGLS